VAGAASAGTRTMHSTTLSFLIGLASAMALTAQHGRYLNESRNPSINDPKAVEEGAKLWSGNCAACHGVDGTGGRGPNLVTRQVWHPLSDQGIHDTILHGVPGTDMPPTSYSDAQAWSLVAFIKAQIGPAAENEAPGDPEAGSKVFWGEKANCNSCHSIRGKGGRMGPDLSDIGGSRPLALIKQAVLSPSGGVVDRHAGGGLAQGGLFGQESVIVKLKNGKEVRGIARNRDNYSLQILDRDGELHLISMLNVDQLTISSHSLMPDDYGKRLSSQELENLFAFLARQTTRPPDAARQPQTAEAAH
jgi:cytochrome c oxidase cbb3-type subunit 3